MKLSKILTPERIKVPMAATDKTAAITELADTLARQGALASRDIALSAVLKRETAGSTGIGCGLAIPHARTEGTQSVVLAAGKPGTPIEFQSLDGKPVTFVVLLLSPPTEMGPHIKVLAEISRLMSIVAFREAVDRAASADQLHAAIAQYEQADT